MTNPKSATPKLLAADAQYILIEPVQVDGTIATYSEVDAGQAAWQITLAYPSGDTQIVTPDPEADFADTFAQVAAALPELLVAYRDADNDLPKNDADGILCDLMDLILDDPEMEDADVTDDHPIEELRTAIDEANMARQPAAPAA